MLATSFLVCACEKGEHDKGKSEQGHGRTSAADPPESAASVVSFMVGEWEGNVHQQKTNTNYVVRVSYLQDGSSAVTYPADRCGGHWTLVNASTSEATFTEHIDYGMSQCTPTGTVVVKDVSGTLSYEWRGNDEVVTGELHRK
jgi:hypothetical protein